MQELTFFLACRKPQILAAASVKLQELKEAEAPGTGWGPFLIPGVTLHMAAGLWASPAPVLCWSLDQKTLCLDVFDP